jgi:hypothetical protein
MRRSMYLAILIYAVCTEVSFADTPRIWLVKEGKPAAHYGVGELLNYRLEVAKGNVGCAPLELVEQPAFAVSLVLAQHQLRPLGRGLRRSASHRREQDRAGHGKHVQHHGDRCVRIKE